MFVKILLDIVVLAKNCSVMCPPVRPRVVWMRCVVQYSSTNRINTITECRSAAAAAGTHCACCSSAVVRRVVGHWVVPRHAARHYICCEIGHNEPLCVRHILECGLTRLSAHDMSVVYLYLYSQKLLRSPFTALFIQLTMSCEWDTFDGIKMLLRRVAACGTMAAVSTAVSATSRHNMATIVLWHVFPLLRW